jgi:integrase
MRPEEVYGLRWRDLDLDRRKLTVNQVVAKTRRNKGDTCACIEFGAPKTVSSQPCGKSRSAVLLPCLPTARRSRKRKINFALIPRGLFPKTTAAPPKRLRPPRIVAAERISHV